MARKKKGSASIPDDVKREVEAIVERFNRENSNRDDCYYEAHFRGKHCYLHRADGGPPGPICRVTYTGKMDGWEFAIFKWSDKRTTRMNGFSQAPSTSPLPLDFSGLGGQD